MEPFSSERINSRLSFLFFFLLLLDFNCMTHTTTGSCVGEPAQRMAREFTESTVPRINDISHCGDRLCCSPPPTPTWTPPPSLSLHSGTVWNQAEHFRNGFVWLMKLIEAKANLSVFIFYFFPLLKGTFQKTHSNRTASPIHLLDWDDELIPK